MEMRLQVRPSDDGGDNIECECINIKGHQRYKKNKK